jgi:hypothetical protein
MQKVLVPTKQNNPHELAVKQFLFDWIKTIVSDAEKNKNPN